MSEKTFRLYDGVTYTDTTYEEIKYNNISIGHFKKKSEIPKTVLGTYLDNETNYNQLKEDIISLSRNTPETYYPLDQNYILTDYENHCFLITTSVKWNATPETPDTLLEGVVTILKQLGYVNKKYELNKEDTPRNIKFFITSPEGVEFSLYFIPMDEYCYRVKTL